MMTPAEMALHAIVIRSMRAVANAWEKWLEEQKLDEPIRVPPRPPGVADREDSAPVIPPTVSPVNQHRSKA